MVCGLYVNESVIDIYKELLNKLFLKMSAVFSTALISTGGPCPHNTPPCLYQQATGLFHYFCVKQIIFAF